ncbi:MAG: hypothetical protein F7C81_03870 [Desulfurococcales archaeon]|nr:hypothetical protein [Desulfurococcales archaeon]
MSELVSYAGESNMGRVIEIAHGWGEVSGGKARLPNIEIDVDSVDVNFVLSAFSACIAKKISLMLELDWVKVDIRSYIDLEDLMKYLDLKIRRLIIEIYLKTRIDKNKVIEAAKECPTIALIEDKVKEFRVFIQAQS